VSVRQTAVLMLQLLLTRTVEDCVHKMRQDKVPFPSSILSFVHLLLLQGALSIYYYYKVNYPSIISHGRGLRPQDAPG